MKGERVLLKATRARVRWSDGAIAAAMEKHDVE